VVNDIGSEPGIRGIRVFNKDGRISFSTNAAEVGRTVDKRDQACAGCHGGKTPLAKLDRSVRHRIFTANGERLVG